jgi:hypothetical protein
MQRFDEFVCRYCPAIFCLYTPSKLSRPYFEFSLKVMGLNAGYLLKKIFFTNFPSQNNFRSDIVLKVRQPSIEEAAKFKEGGTLYSFLYPAQNKELIDEMAKYKLTAFGMDCVPRISRAQVFDALSSMGNISGTRFDAIFPVFSRKSV